MADQVFQLEAGVVDGFSAPLKRLRAQLADVKPSEGMKQTAAHFDTLRTRVNAATTAIGRDMNTALSGLGVSSIGAIASIAGVAAAVKRFSESTIEIRQFERATGMAADTLRRFQKAGPEFGVNGDAVGNALRTLSSKMHDFRRGMNLGDVYAAGEGELADRIRNSKTPDEALRFALNRAAEVNQKDGPERGRRLLDAFGIASMHEFTLRGKAGVDEIFNRKVSPISAEDEAKARAYARAMEQVNDAVNSAGRGLAIGFTPHITAAMTAINTALDSGGVKRVMDFFDAINTKSRAAGQSTEDFLKKMGVPTLREFFTGKDKDGNPYGGLPGNGFLKKTSFGGAAGLGADDSGVRTVHLGVLGAMREFAGLGGGPAGSGEARLERASYGGGGAGGAARAMQGIRGRFGADGGDDAAPGRGGGAAGSAQRSAMMGYAMDELRKLGVPDANRRAAAAMLVGQADSESKLNPNAVHDNKTGYGIYGARLPRRDAMLAWLAKHGYARNSAEGQMRYMAREAMTVPTYSATRRALMGATPENMGPNTAAVTRNFESPARINDRRGAVFQAYRSGGLLDAAKGAGIGGNGGGRDPNNGHLDITINGLPKGWRSRAEGTGIFRDYGVNMGKPLSDAGEDV